MAPSDAVVVSRLPHSLSLIKMLDPSLMDETSAVTASVEDVDTSSLAMSITTMLLALYVTVAVRVVPEVVLVPVATVPTDVNVALARPMSQSNEKNQRKPPSMDFSKSDGLKFDGGGAGLRAKTFGFGTCTVCDSS